MKLTIRVKLMIGYAATLGLMLTVSILAYFALNNVNKTVSQILVHAHKYDMVVGLRHSAKNFLDINDAMIKEQMSDMEYYKPLVLDVEKKILYVGKLRLKEHEKEFLKKIKDEFNFIKERAQELFKLAAAGRNANIVPLLKDMDKAKLVLINNMDALYDEAWRSLDNISIAADKAKEKALHQIITFSVIAIVAGIWISIYMSRKITTPIRALSMAASSVAKGAPYPEVEKTTEDELGELVASFNQMALDLKTSRDQIEIYNKELQTMVEERTAELEKTKEYLENILEYSGDMIITTTLYDEIVQFNRGAENILGYNIKNMVGVRFEDLFVDKREYRRIRERAVEDGNVSSYDTRLMKKSGDIVSISLTVSRLKDRRGTVIGLVVIGKDITKKEEGQEI
jgi:two-component system nitrogen regulation sensor histidine kinase NtrY